CGTRLEGPHPSDRPRALTGRRLHDSPHPSPIRRDLAALRHDDRLHRGDRVGSVGDRQHLPRRADRLRRRHRAGCRPRVPRSAALGRCGGLGGRGRRPLPPRARRPGPRRPRRTPRSGPLTGSAPAGVTAAAVRRKDRTLMATASIAGRLRSVTTLVAAAALLGLGACSSDAGEDPEESAPAPTTSSDDGGAQETGQETDEQDEATDEETTSQDEETSSATGERTRIMLRIDLGVDDSTGEGDLTLPGDDLAALLAEPFGGEAECADPLELAP